MNQNNIPALVQSLLNAVMSTGKSAAEAMAEIQSSGLIDGLYSHASARK